MFLETLPAPIKENECKTKMGDRTKIQIEELVDHIFLNRKAREYRALRDELLAHKRAGAAKGTIGNSGFHARAGKMYGEFFIRILDQTLDELERTFKEAGRRDGTFYWNVIAEKLRFKIDEYNVRYNNEALDWSNSLRSGGAGFATYASSGYRSIGDRAQSIVEGKIAELRVRTQVLLMKSPQDRKANNIPDVAVMMWFPKEDDKENRAKAEAKYAAICQAVSDASNGKATVDKVDNPNLVHRDRITPVVEEWLSKAVLVICDLEQNRPNVFYEFGFTRAVGTDVIAIRPTGTPTDFHLAQWNIDEYADWDELKRKITPRIEKIVSQYDLSGTV